MLRERGFNVGREVRAELKQPRNVAFHRLAHALGNLLRDNVEAMQGLTGHDALKRVQRESGVCCERIEVDLGPLGKVPVMQARSLAFDDMADDGWQGMLCIETANVLDDVVMLAPGASHTMGVSIASLPL